MTKYGKEVSMRNLNRDLVNIQKIIDNAKVVRKKHVVHIDETYKFECRICHSHKFSDYVDVDGYKYVLCKHCHSIVMTNLPDVKSLYDTGGVSIDIYANEDLFHKRIDSIAMPKAVFVIDEIIKQNKYEFDEAKIWVDIGCGVGELLMAIKKLSDERNLNIKPVGIESDTREISFGQRFDLDIQCGFVNPSNLSDSLADLISNADIISLFNVLEHVIEPDNMITCLAKHMKKNAVLVIEVPRHPSLASFANITAPHLSYRHITPPVHLQIFSEKSMNILFENLFSVFAMWGFGQGYTDVLTNAMLIGKPSDTSLYEELMNISNEVQKVIDEMGYSDTMIFVTQKL